MGRIGRAFLVASMMAGLVLSFLVSGFATDAVGAEIETPQQTSWGIVNQGASANVAGWRGLGWAVDQVGDNMFVGGNFLDVTDGDQTESQPYLAAFDVLTGDFNPDFRPDVGNAVMSFQPSPDGGVFVGGEMRTWNGQNVGSLVKIDPDTGELWPGFSTRVFGGNSIVRDMKIEADGWLYIAGTFDTVSRAGVQQSASNAIRINPTTGVIDSSWKPQLDGGAWGISRSKVADTVYLAGRFIDVNGLGWERSAGFVGVDDSAEVVVERGQVPLNRTCVTGSRYCLSMHDVEAAPNGNVWITGVEHATFVLEETNNYNMKIMHHTDCYNSPTNDCSRRGGDGQELEIIGDRVYATCHCWGQHYSSTDEIIMFRQARELTPNADVASIIAYDINSAEHVPSFDPYLSGDTGAWDLTVDTNGCMWATGGYTRVGNPAIEPTQTARDLIRLCDEGVAPGIGAPATCEATKVGTDATISWDATPGVSEYRVYRSVDGGNEFWRGKVEATSFDDELRSSGSHEYSVASVLPDGSATERTPCGTLDPNSGAGAVTAPTTCTATNAGVDATVEWAAVNGADGYRVYRSVDGGNQFWRGKVEATSFDDELRSSGSHEYFVSTVLPDGTATERTPCGSLDPADGVDPDGVDPVLPAAAPASCSVAKTGSDATVTWPVSADANNYRIFRSADGGNAFWRGAGPDTTFVDPLRAGPEFVYSVQARGEVGDWSDSTICSPGISL